VPTRNECNEKLAETRMRRSNTCRLHSALIAASAIACFALAGCCQLFPDQCGQSETMLRTDVILVRSGGLVGTNDQVTVTQDGTFASSGKLIPNQSRPLSSLELNGVLDRLGGWDQLTVGAPGTGCADVFEYSITYAGRTLTWNVCTKDVPQQLRDLA